MWTMLLSIKTIKLASGTAKIRNIVELTIIMRNSAYKKIAIQKTASRNSRPRPIAALAEVALKRGKINFVALS